MTFSLPDNWVWDLWFADDGDVYHLYFLHAPHSLGDPDLRHRNARIGHATSTDLKSWRYDGVALVPGESGAVDGSATWTGSIVKGPDGQWHMFYTGSRFLSETSSANIETVCAATSRDLTVWTKRSGFSLSADAQWYETLGTSSWPEEAWRDPWVFFSSQTGLWHMLVTARANHGTDDARGVIGHAKSKDLLDWQVEPPLSSPEQGFGHLEVPQIVEIEGRFLLIFSCNSPRLAGKLAGTTGGIWVAPAQSPTGPFDIDAAYLLASEDLYAGRLVKDRQGTWNLVAFEAENGDGEFVGSLTDPLPVAWNAASGRLELTSHPDQKP